MSEPVPGTAADPGWQRDWDAMVAAVGQEFGDGTVVYCIASGPRQH